MQSMLLAKHLLLHAAALITTTAGLAAAQATFQASASVLYCASRVKTMPALSESECALRCFLADVWRSFSFINGVCFLSDNSLCTVSCAGLIWVKNPMVSSTTFGYEQLIGDRRFWVFQQRKNGVVSFARSWIDYEQGFGNDTEFWGGLLSLNSLTCRGNATLRMEMTTLNGTQYVAEWSNFIVTDASTNYTLQYKSFLTASSNVSGDALAANKGIQFSTFDRDNDHYNKSCSALHGNSGFWYNYCGGMFANERYSTIERASYNYMSCANIYQSGNYNTLREMRMMLQLN